MVLLRTRRFTHPGGVQSIAVARESVQHTLGVGAVLPRQIEFQYPGLPPLRMSDAFLRVDGVQVCMELFEVRVRKEFCEPFHVTCSLSRKFLCSSLGLCWASLGCSVGTPFWQLTATAL